jgi:metal-sulfur cluster biosynthetic enzyme
MSEDQNSEPVVPPPPPASPPPTPENTANAPAEKAVGVEEVREALKNVFDPEIPINIVDLGLIYKLEVNEGSVTLDMTLTTPLCPLAGQIRALAVAMITGLPGIKSVNVNLVFDPPWSKDRMTEEGKLQASMLGFM